MADTLEDLRCEVKAAVVRHFQNGPKPVSTRLAPGARRCHLTGVMRHASARFARRQRRYHVRHCSGRIAMLVLRHESVKTQFH